MHKVLCRFRYSFTDSHVDRLTVTYPPSSLSYAQTITDAQSLVNIPDVSPSYAGLLYFPTNPRNCSDPSIPDNGIPANAITFDRIPLGFNLIALVPITACTSDYLMQAKRDQAEAVVLYNYTSTSSMPSPSLTNTFSIFNNPIYGITADDVAPLLKNMVNYAGNMSSVPFGGNLSLVYDPLDYVRLTLTIDPGQGSSLPGLWLFLLVILAALGLIIASTSISMHISQYRARRDLRRRLARGEIDLEALGIKRLTVPKEMVDAMPIKIYGAAPVATVSNEPSTPRTSADANPHNSISTNPSSGNSDSNEAQTSSTTDMSEDTRSTAPGFGQTCAICLDDFVVNTTPVRQLPCNHIYHPHCIDPFLLTRSSQCPLCKRTVLPKGFIPPSLQLTNATVARERRIRLMRERAARPSSNSADPAALENGPSDIEMVSPGANQVTSGQDIDASTHDHEEEEPRQPPLTRRIWDAVFPSLARPIGGFRFRASTRTL